MSVPQPEMKPSDDEPTLVRVTLVLCSLCLSGAGGRCHMPGCALWMIAAPDAAIADHCETLPWWIGHDRIDGPSHSQRGAVRLPLASRLWRYLTTKRISS